MEIINISAAILAPLIAIIGVVLGIINYKLGLRKRKDEFLKDFERLWKTTGLESECAVRMNLEWDDIEPWAQEAYYLFGTDIADHLKSYEGKSYSEGFKWVPDLELSKPFNKYLCFENS